MNNINQLENVVADIADEALLKNGINYFLFKTRTNELRVKIVLPDVMHMEEITFEDIPAKRMLQIVQGLKKDVTSRLNKAVKTLKDKVAEEK